MSSKIITLPHASLRMRSQQLSYIDVDSTQKLIDEMIEATLNWEASREHEVGVALAAVQINVLKRVVIIRNNFNNKKDTGFQVFINPKIVKYEGEIIEDYEGCLSVKDAYGRVPRYKRVKVKALNLAGKEVRITAEDFLARVFQHEIDHTNGIVFVDRIKESPESFYKLGPQGNIEDITNDEREKFFRIFW